MCDGSFQTQKRRAKFPYVYLNIEPIWSHSMVCETTNLIALQGPCLSLMMFSNGQEQEIFVLTILYNRYNIKLLQRDCLYY